MGKNPYFEHLFSPIQVGGVTYKNRVASTPLGNTSVRPDGSFPATSFQIYEDRARGGCAEVSASETIVDFEYGSRLFVPPVDYTDPNSLHNQGLRKYTAMLHSYGALATVELNHCGGNRFASAGKVAIGPSAMADHNGVQVLEMDEALMERTVDAFAQTAWYLQQAGYDGVIPHMASGWLLQQFLSPHVNHRTDEYGGSAENRARFPLRVLRGIREKCGPGLLIIPRLSCREYLEDGYDVEDAVTFCRLAEQAGLIDMVNVTAGVYYDPVRSKEFSSMYEPHNLHWELSEAIKKVCSIPVMLTGGINSPEEAEQLIAQGKCDLIGLGRQMLADPNWAKKAEEGRADDIARCIRCFRCFPGPLKDTGGKPLTPPDKKCTVNPCSDLTDLEVPLCQWPAPTASRKVLVIGGGVAGMTAAYTAAQRGHQVILAEASGELGGLLTFTDYDFYKYDLRNYMKLCIRRVERSGVDIRLNTPVTPENLAGFGADEVIVAVGSSPICPPIPGIDTTVSAIDAYRYPEKLGDRVVIAGGGQVGCEAALNLSHLGKQVAIVEMREDVAIDSNPMHRIALMDMLAENGVTIRAGLKCKTFRPDGVLCENGEGEDVLLAADSVVLALGMRANQTLAQSLEAAAGDKVQLIGDCIRASKVQTAVEEGFLAAMRVV